MMFYVMYILPQFKNSFKKEKLQRLLVGFREREKMQVSLRVPEALCLPLGDAGPPAAPVALRGGQAAVRPRSPQPELPAHVPAAPGDSRGSPGGLKSSIVDWSEPHCPSCC